MSERWDVDALKSGALTSLMFAAPFVVIAALIRDKHDKNGSGWGTLLFFAALTGFFLGAGVAAWRQTVRAPLSHALVASTGTFVVVQGIFAIIRLVRGEDVRWFSIVFTLTLVSGVGLIGGLMGMNLQKRGFEPKR